MYWGHHMDAGGWVFSILATIVFLALFVAVIVWAAGTFARGQSQTPTHGSPREILDHRLASGKITTEQYDQLRKKLDSNPPSTTEQRGIRLGAPGGSEFASS
jgi:uncharacterized membrane protein